MSFPLGCLLMYNDVKRIFFVKVLIVDASIGFNSVNVVPISPSSRPVEIKFVFPSGRMMSSKRVNIFLHSVAALVSVFCWEQSTCVHFFCRSLSLSWNRVRAAVLPMRLRKLLMVARDSGTSRSVTSVRLSVGLIDALLSLWATTEFAECESCVSDSIDVTVAVVVTPDMVDRAEWTEPESIAACDCEIWVIDEDADEEFAFEIRLKFADKLGGLGGSSGRLVAGFKLTYVCVSRRASS